MSKLLAQNKTKLNMGLLLIINSHIYVLCDPITVLHLVFDILELFNFGGNKE